MEVGKAIGMVIGGRAARACDACGRERARWYCAADEAYLCERCDSTVHNANTVAKRHERVRLGSNGAPVKIERSSSGVVKKDDPSGLLPASRGGWQHTSRKRSRTRRHNHGFAASRVAKTSFANSLADMKVKPEPCSPGAEVQVPENHLFESFFDSKELQNDALLLHEVPIYMPLDQELAPFDCADLPEEKPVKQDSSFQVSSGRIGDAENHEEHVDFLVPGSCIDIDHFLDSEADLCDLDVDIDCVTEEGHEMPCTDGMGMLSFCDGRALKEPDHSPAFSDGGAPKVAEDQSEGGYGELCMGGESLRTWLYKVKVESSPELRKTELDAASNLGEKLYGFQYKDRPKLGLRLNLEDVLSAWSDRGSLWMDGHPPAESSLDCLAGFDTGLVPDLSLNSSSSTQSGEHPGQVPVSKDRRSGAREARVMRYREKRRTRLFSKKIRYEVRKLNAEKRPRMKGRFVKRIPGMPAQ